MEKDDESFVFDDTNNEHSESCPEYIVSGIMAGLYYLPPESLLKTQSGWGRRIRYRSFRHVFPNWQALPLNHNEYFNEGIMKEAFVATLGRTISNDSLGTFRIYLFKTNADLCSTLNSDLKQLAAAHFESKDSSRISMSNAGGFHGLPNFLNSTENASVCMLSRIIEHAVNSVEADDYNQSKAAAYFGQQEEVANKAFDGLPRDAYPIKFGNNKLRKLQSVMDCEAWINVNQHGNWNRLHTHEGACWSGVYYIQANHDTSLHSFSGMLMFKPSPHASEITHQLSDVEMARLNAIPLATSPLPPTHSDVEGNDALFWEPVKMNGDGRIAGDGECEVWAENDHGLRHRGNQQNQTDQAGQRLVVEEARPVPGPSSPQAGSLERLLERCGLDSAPEPTRCDCVQIRVEEGCVLVFPSWLHHAVLPLAVRPEHRHTPEGLRISLAFNFNEAW